MSLNDSTTLSIDEPIWTPEEPAKPPEGFALPLSVFELAVLSSFRQLRLREQLALFSAMRCLVSGERP